MIRKTYIPTERVGWWGGLDTRERCAMTGKVCKSEEAAHRTASRIQRQARLNPHDRYMQAYRCRECGHWHLGHRYPEKSK